MGKRVIPLALAIVLSCLPLAGEGSAQEAVEEALDSGQKALQDGNTQEAIAHLLEAIRQQNELIRQLQQAAAAREEVFRQQEESLTDLEQKLSEQETVIEEQKTTIAEYEKKIEEHQSTTMSSIAAVEEVRGIEEMYQQAHQTRRTGIFDVRRRDAEPYFRRAIEQYRYIAETYPESRRAPDAQFQVAKTYHRWLNDSTQAIREYRRLIEKWPESSFASEAEEALGELGEPAAP